ncbi:MAG: hypothetical protein FJ104_13955, partial [Deltaproteobacteria bacterium]|nr:hypothetical protein [Deltaproteobacteria bacterium]
MAGAAADLLPTIAPGAGAGPGQADEFWVLDRVAAALTGAGQPRVVVVDDVQWADRASLRVLSLLGPDVAASPLVVVLTLREPAELAPEASTALRRVLRHAESLPLAELGQSEVSECVQRSAGLAPTDELLAELLRRTAGNPLLLRETMALLAVRHGARWPVEARADEVTLAEVGRELIRSRLRGLGAEALRVLSVASVIGESFSLPVLDRTVGLAPERLLVALDAAVEAHAIEELPGVGEYGFSHALLRDVLADDLPRAERAPLHAAVADALSRVPGAPDGELAAHYHHALPLGDRDRAIEHARAAGRAALDLFSYDQATRYFEWALEATRYGDALPPEFVAELHLDAARGARLAHRAEASRRHLAVAIDLGKRHALGGLLVRAGRRLRSSYAWRTAPDPLAREALEEALRLVGAGDPALRIRALSELAGIPPYSLKRSESRPLAEEALALAAPLGGRSRVDALRARLFSATGPDDIDRLLATTEEILTLEATHGRTWMSADALYAEICARLLGGDLARAEAALDRFGALARELRLAEALWQHDRVRAQLAFARADFATAERAWVDLASRGERIGLDYSRLLLPTHLGVLAAERDGTSTVALAGDALDRVWEWMKRETRHRATMARMLLEGGRRADAAAEFASLVDDALPGLEPDYH